MTEEAKCPTCGKVLPGLDSPCLDCDATMAQDVEPVDPLGSLSERYEFVKPLGAGAMGRVDLALDKRLERHVAVKRILNPEDVKPSFLQRFLREATTLAKFRHPNIVNVLDVGEDELGSYIIMEFVDGGALEGVLRKEGRFPLKRALKITRQLLSALAVLHEQEVIHRDIKPLNIILQRTPEGDCPVLIDFGLVRDQADQELTVAGSTLGTLHYMAPEQWADSSDVDGRADLYAVGATLYRMLTGRTPAEILRDEIPFEARNFTMKLLERSRKMRPSSAAEALQMLEGIECDSLTGEAEQAASTGPPPPEGTQASDISAVLDRKKDVSSDICASCGRDIVSEYLECTVCRDERSYCSGDCFEQHQEDEHCAECSKPLISRYVYSAELNSAMGRDLRFCSSDCRRLHQQQNLCVACGSRLPREFWHAEDITSAIGYKAHFCSSSCVERFREDRMCRACGRVLSDRYLTCPGCQGRGGFCSDSCFDRHASEAHGTAV